MTTKTLEGMRGGEIDFIPDRLIADPAVFMGLTDSEIITIGLGSLAVWVPISILLLLPFGAAFFGLGLGLALAMGTLFFASRYLTRIKRRLPNGQHLVYLKKRAQLTGLVSYQFITRTGHWDVRRTRPVDRPSEIDS